MPPIVIDLTNLAASDGFIIQGDAAFDQAGYSVSGAGDVNGDGIDDLIVGARLGDDGGTAAGEAYVIYGSRLFGGINGTAAGETLNGTPEADQINGLAGDDVLNGLASNDILNGGDGDDTLDGGTGDDRMVGGTGNDICIVDSALDIVTEAANEGIDEIRTTVRKPPLAANVENLTYTGLENFSGRGNNLGNVITGASGNDVIFGKDGDDTLNAGDGNDILDGGAGADTVNGGDGDDLIYVGDASDTIDGGAGRDTIAFFIADTVFAASSSSNVEVFENQSGGNLNAGLNSGDNVFGGSIGIDTIDGGAGNDALYGRAGNDVFSGGDGSDQLFGMEDNDVLNGGNGNDSLYGDAGNDTLFGNAGDDVLYGEDGVDDLTGGSGIDLMGGGSGADRFIFAAGDTGNTLATADRIIDFSSAQGDRIDLSAINATASAQGGKIGGDDVFPLIDTAAFGHVPGQLRYAMIADLSSAQGDRIGPDFIAVPTDGAFTFIGTAAFSNVAGQLRYELIGGSTYVMGDTNGDSVADIVIKLDGNVPLNAGDFIL